MASTTQACGNNYELLASSFLRKQGLKLITKNFRSRFGEIDLIMKDEDQLVFVEVRYRKHLSRGRPHHTVTLSKQKKIIKTAKLFLVKQGLYDQVPCRFDIVGITELNKVKDYTWVRSAFC